jgi:transposase
MLADAMGRPLRFVLSAGEVHDCTQADRLFEDIETGHVIADKGYDSERVLEKIKELGASAVIPPKSNRKGAKRLRSGAIQEAQPDRKNLQQAQTF